MWQPQTHRRCRQPSQPACTGVAAARRASVTAATAAAAAAGGITRRMAWCTCAACPTWRMCHARRTSLDEGTSPCSLYTSSTLKPRSILLVLRCEASGNATLPAFFISTGGLFRYSILLCCRHTTYSDQSSGDEERSSSSGGMSPTSMRRYSSQSRHSRHEDSRAGTCRLQDGFWPDSRVRAVLPHCSDCASGLCPLAQHAFMCTSCLYLYYQLTCAAPVNSGAQGAIKPAGLAGNDTAAGRQHDRHVQRQ